MRRRPMRDTAGLDREPAVFWLEPHLELEPASHSGPVLVTVSYPMRPANEQAFIEAMAAVPAR